MSKISSQWWAPRLGRWGLRSKRNGWNGAPYKWPEINDLTGIISPRNKWSYIYIYNIYTSLHPVLRTGLINWCFSGGKKSPDFLYGNLLKDVAVRCSGHSRTALSWWFSKGAEIFLTRGKEPCFVASCTKMADDMRTSRGFSRRSVMPTQCLAHMLTYGVTVRGTSSHCDGRRCEQIGIPETKHSTQCPVRNVHLSIFRAPGCFFTRAFPSSVWTIYHGNFKNNCPQDLLIENP